MCIIYIYTHINNDLHKYDENPKDTKNTTDFTCQYSPHKYENI